MNNIISIETRASMYWDLSEVEAQKAFDFGLLPCNTLDYWIACDAHERACDAQGIIAYPVRAGAVAVKLEMIAQGLALTPENVKRVLHKFK